MKWLVIILLIILVVVNGYNMFGSVEELESSDEISQVCFENNCFDVEIADDDNERSEGLMFRDSLCSDCGMLFIYDELASSKFWMKNTLIPLDIIWMDENFVVQYIVIAEPCVTDVCELYGPSTDVESLYVLEINKGKSDEIELGVGDVMEIG